MAHERPTHTDILAEKAVRISEETGIDPELCRLSAAWAQDMAAVVRDNPPEVLGTHYFGQLMEETGERILVLPRDADGVPLYRMRYVAGRIFYELVASRYPEARNDIEGSPLEITVHYDRLDEICQALLGIQGRNEYPYDMPDAEVPNRSEHMPSETVLPRGTEQHAQYLWHICYWMGGGIDSNLVFKYLSMMYADHPELFDPRYIVENEVTEEQVASVISQYSALNFNLDRVKNYWITNAHRMVGCYDGDVRALFDGASSYRTIKKRLVNNKKGQGFLGFQEKMASMYTHFLADAGVVEEIPFPPPVDFHLLRLATSLGILTYKNMGRRGVLEKKTISTLRKVLYDYIITTGISEVELDDALWRYSKLMCAKAPSNGSTVDYSAAHGEKSVATVPNYSDPTTLHNYAKSCGRCVVSHLCTFSLSSGAYYADDSLPPVKPLLPHDEPALIQFSDSMLAPPPNQEPAIISSQANKATPPSHLMLDV